MIKLNIFNMKGFMEVVNKSSGPVNLISESGRKMDISKDKIQQRLLEEKHLDNGKYLSVWLEVPGVRDYLDIVSFAAGDC